MPDQDKKDLRRQKLSDRTHKKIKISDEQRYLSKSKKQLKQRMQEMQADEKWNEWDEWKDDYE